MEQDEEKTPPSSAGCDTDRCEKRDNSAQKDERNEERKESLFEHEEGQRSITEEQETADCTFDPVEIAKHLSEVYDGLDPAVHRKSDSKQSKPSTASASVPPCSETRNVIFQGSGAAEKQKEHMFPIKWNEPGSLSDLALFSTLLNSNVTGHNITKIKQKLKEIQQLEHAVLVQQHTLTALRERIRRVLERGSPALSGPSSSAHLSCLSECAGPSDTTPSYSPHNWSLTNIIGESRQKDAFSVRSQSEPGVYHSFVGEMGSSVTAEQSLIREKTAADESKPQSIVSSTSPVTSAEMLRDSLKDSTPGTPVGTKRMTFVWDPPKRQVQTFTFSPVHPTPALHHHYHQQQLKPISFRPVRRRGVEKINPGSPSTSVHHDPSTSDPVLGAPFHNYGAQGKSGNKVPQSKTIIPPVSVFSHLIRVVPQESSTAEKQKEQTFPIKRTIQRSLSEPSLAASSRNVESLQTSELEKFLRKKIRILRGQVRNLPSLINEEEQCLKWLQHSKNFSHGYNIHPCFPSQFAVDRDFDYLQRNSSGHSFTKEKETQKKTRQRWKKSSNIASTSDSPDDILDQPPPALTETGMKNKASSAAGDTTAVSQDNTGEMECVTGPSTLQPSTSNDDDSDFSLLADAFSPWSLQPESESGSDRDVHVEMEDFVTAVNLSATKTLPTHSHLLQTPDCFRSRRASTCLPRSHSVSSLSQTRSENKILRRTKSLPNMLLKSSVVEFTPDITDDGNDESYRFLCSSPGLYQCSVTGLVFHMDGEGDVVYRIVPWNRRLLAHHHKQPAGPLFDIKCLQQSVCQLHLPHCEIRSTGGCEFLSVAHVHDEGIEFISPHQITDTHVIINITGFSGFGNVKDEDSPPDPVRALVLLFYKPPAAPDVKSVLNVLMLPRNVVLREVQRTRKNSKCEDENYIETPPHCKLHPQQEYTLSTCPEDESVLVQPKIAEFECDNYDNYFSSFQVIIKKLLKHINLFLRDSNKHSVWEREVCLSSTGVKRSCLQGKSTERLLEIRSSFIDGISAPFLKDLLDKLFEETVITDSERESADAIQVTRDKARFVIDTVRKKGEAASSEMIEYLCEVDSFLCEHLGLI